MPIARSVSDAAIPWQVDDEYAVIARSVSDAAIPPHDARKNEITTSASDLLVMTNKVIFYQ